MARTFDDDQALLDELLRDAVRAAGDGEVLEVHDRAVELATAARGGDDAASERLAELVAGLDVRGAELLVRSLTRWFQLVNLAEDNERIRRLQAREAANGDTPRAGSVADAIGRLAGEGTTADELGELLEQAGFAVTRLLGLRHGRRLTRLDRRFSSLVDAQLAGPPATWHRELRHEVARVRPKHFRLRQGDLDTSLDLVAVAVATP